MATTKIWAVKDNLKRVINYASNTDKTKTDDNTLDGLENVLEYSTNDSKTEKKLYVSGINCLPKTSYEEMLNTKKSAGKEGGVLAFHAYQSFRPGEVDAKTAHKIGVELANLMWGKDFEVVVATHLDKAHLHNHFVVNSVSFMTKKRFTNRHEDYRKFKNLSDALCYEHNLNVIESNKSGLHYGEINAIKNNYPTKRSLIIRDVEEAISKSSYFNEFISHMEQLGYEIKYGKHIAVRMKGTDKYYRLYKLDKDEKYSEGNIKMRLLNKSFDDGYVIQPKTKYVALNKKNDKKIKLKGFKALYFKYMYLLGVIPKNRYKYAYIHPALRDDITKVNNYTKETYFIFKNNLHTNNDLYSLKESLQEEKNTLISTRNIIYSKLKRCDESQKEEFLLKRDTVSMEIRQINSKLKMCENIEQRAEYMKDKLQAMNKLQSAKEEKQSKKEKMI